MKKENYKYWRIGVLIFALFKCAAAGARQRSLVLWLGSSAVICLLMTPYLIADWYKEKEKNNAACDIQKELQKDEFVKKILEQQSQKAPSEDFAAFAVFRIIDQRHEEFEKIVCSTDAGKLHAFFINAYNTFINHPETIGFTSDLINKNNQDTSPAQWNTDIFKLGNGDCAALLFMPVRHDTLAARTVGVILSDKGDAHYYCMVNKDEQAASAVMRRRKTKADRIGEVNGLGLELMQKFLNCMKNDFYRPDSWEIYRRQHVISGLSERYIGTRHQEMVHILRLGRAFPLDELAEESTSLDGFIAGIRNEMFKKAVRISEELSENSDKKVFTLFYYNYEPDSNRNPEISPGEIAWFYMLLNREKVAHFLEPYQLNKLDRLLSADRVEFRLDMETSEWCKWLLLELRNIYADSDCSVFNWDYVISKGGRESKFAWLYAYHMGCSEETAVQETRTVLNKMIDPKLKTLYPGWEMAVSRSTGYMIRDCDDLSPEDWLSFNHPFFEAHSKNPEESAKQYYDLFYSDYWPYQGMRIEGHTDNIEYHIHYGSKEYGGKEYTGKEDADLLSIKCSEINVQHDWTEYGEDETVKFRFISECNGDTPAATDDCGVPCKGWYDKDGRRFLIDPLGMSGLFEYCDVMVSWADGESTTVSGIGRV